MYIFIFDSKHIQTSMNKLLKHMEIHLKSYAYMILSPRTKSQNYITDRAKRYQYRAKRDTFCKLVHVIFQERAKRPTSTKRPVRFLEKNPFLTALRESFSNNQHLSKE